MSPGVRCQRRHTDAVPIALELLRHREVLRLRPARIVADVVDRFQVPCYTARAAVALARRNARAG